MPVKVIDASALAALLFAEPSADSIAEQMHNCSMVAPVLLPFEIASVCLKKLRNHPSRRTQLLGAYGLLHRLEIAKMDVDFDEVILIAENKKVTAYDGAYLWLARRLGAELITLDKNLAAAARPV